MIVDFDDLIKNCNGVNILNEGKRLLNHTVPTRCGELTPLDSS